MQLPAASATARFFVTPNPKGTPLSMKKPAKRACDSCIARKVRCDGAWPCETCETSARHLQCTYDKPAQKRGPKVRRTFIQKQRSLSGSNSDDIPILGQELEGQQQAIAPWQDFSESPVDASLYLKEALSKVIREYESQSYGVWPIICSDVLVQQLSRPVYEEPSVYGLATALCAATMAQLDLDPVSCCVGDDIILVDSSYFSQECIRIREQYQYREQLDIRWVLASFFLHVFHAKTDKRNSALMFIQEALTSARLLGLDRNNEGLIPAAGMIDNGEILFPLLWVSERGYSMHLGLTPSLSYKLPDQFLNTTIDNAHVKGMIALAELFVTFDQCANDDTSQETLVESERLLREIAASEDINATRLADLAITREWMRTMIWQQGLSAGYLSFDSETTTLNFNFPAVIGHDLLAALREFSAEDLLPLGRDQLLKCYEVANTLADTLLCNSTLTESSRLQCGPYDFLHGLYQKIQPFLFSDIALDSILRDKTAETFKRIPSSLRSLSLPPMSTEDDIVTQTNSVLVD